MRQLYKQEAAGCTCGGGKHWWHKSEVPVEGQIYKKDIPSYRKNNNLNNVDITTPTHTSEASREQAYKELDELGKQARALLGIDVLDENKDNEKQVKTISDEEIKKITEEIEAAVRELMERMPEKHFGKHLAW